MEVSTTCGEIKKFFKIEQFSSYIKTTDKISLEFPIILENFRSLWKIIVYPMHPSKPNLVSSIDCDVTINLICSSSSAPYDSIKEIEFECLIKKRENYPVSLCSIKDSESPTWIKPIISRIALESLRVIQDDIFEFTIIFKIPHETLHMSEDGKLAVVHNIESILDDPQYFDTCLLSSTGVKFYAHSSILHARSNIMNTGKVLRISQLHESQTSTSIDEPLILSQGYEEISKLDKLNEHENKVNNIYSTSSSFDQTSSSSLENSNGFEASEDKSCFTLSTKCKKPLFTMSASPSCFNKVNLKTQSPFSSPMKAKSPSTASPKRRKGIPTITPKKTKQIVESPRKGNSSQSKLTKFFPYSSKSNVQIESSYECTIPYFSPIKAENSSLNTPAKSDTHNHISPILKNSNKKRETESKLQSLTKTAISLNSDIKSPCGIIPKLNMQTPKRKLFDDQIKEDSNITILKLGMSTSVLQELLCWIYSGESKCLGVLSRPLLAAASRHNIPDLFRATQFHLSSILNINNAADLLYLSYKYQAQILFENSMKFAVINASLITSTSSWTKLCTLCPEIVVIFTRKLAAHKS